jgi:hypothetical protein
MNFVPLTLEADGAADPPVKMATSFKPRVPAWTSRLADSNTVVGNLENDVAPGGT